MPDRNLVSRIANIACAGHVKHLDKTTQIAIDLMAFAQSVDISFEPSIAYHELAHKRGDENALKELNYFRLADAKNSDAWINLAQRRENLIQIKPIKNQDNFTGSLSRPLRRWNRNYIATLKMGELELKHSSQFDKFISYLEWMFSDFIMAGPAAMYAARYFATCGNRRGLVKQLKSSNRIKAIEGLRNAAWDITYLSDFIFRLQNSEQVKTRYIFATGDKLLSDIASVLINHPNKKQEEQELFKSLELWWGDKYAQKIHDALTSYYIKIQNREDLSVRSPNKSIDKMINMGEKFILSHEI